MVIPLRDARDRLIERLSLGRTYPLRNLCVSESLIVAYKASASIRIDDSQKGVTYVLHDQRKPVKNADNKDIEMEGTGGTIELKTPPMDGDNTFEIFAVKMKGREKDLNYSTYLIQTVLVRVQVDETLKAYIRSGEPLDPLVDDGTRIVEYGTQVEVEIQLTQEGVTYQLVSNAPEKPLSEQIENGNLGSVKLVTNPMFEDSIIRVRATRAFPGSDTDSRLLTTELKLKVRANSALELKPRPSPIMAYAATTTLAIAKTQASVSYRLYSRPIADADYIHGESTEGILVDIAGDPPVRVRAVDFSTADAQFSPLGQPQSGNGGELTFTLSPFEEDVMIIVRASKTHTLGTRTVGSSRWLSQVSPILVRPNPAPNLTLTVQIANGQTDGQLLVENGQLGVFYDFGLGADRQPAYFHKPNKGLNLLALGVDFVIGRDSQVDKPLVDTKPLPLGTILNITARKAQTSITAPLAKTARIDVLPDIHLQDPIVNYNAETYMVVPASVVGEKYQPYLNGAVFKLPRNGNGDELKFKTDPLTADTTYVMYITRPQDPGIPVLRMLPMTVRVRPNPRLTITPTQATISAGSTVDVRIESAQTGVIYQLMQADTPTGAAVLAQNTTLTLRSGPINAATTLTIRASRADDPDLNVILTPTISVTIGN